MSLSKEEKAYIKEKEKIYGEHLVRVKLENLNNYIDCVKQKLRAPFWTLISVYEYMSSESKEHSITFKFNWVAGYPCSAILNYISYQDMFDVYCDLNGEPFQKKILKESFMDAYRAPLMSVHKDLTNNTESQTLIQEQKSVVDEKEEKKRLKELSFLSREDSSVILACEHEMGQKFQIILQKYDHVQHPNTIFVENGSITYLNMHISTLSGGKNMTKVPEGIGTLTHLENLYIVGTNVEIIPQQIENLNKLHVIDWMGNLIKKCPSFHKFKELSLVKLKNNMMEHLPNGLWNCENLQRFDLTNNPLVDSEMVIYQKARMWGTNPYGEVSGLGIKFLLKESFKLDQDKGIAVPSEPPSWVVFNLKEENYLSFLEVFLNEYNEYALEFLANSLLYLKKYTEATLVFNQLIDISPRKLGEWNHGLAKIYMQQGNWNKVDQYIQEQQAIYKQQGWKPPYFLLAEYDIAKKDWSSALNHIKLQGTTSGFIYYQMGMSYFGLGQYKEAKEAFLNSIDTFKSYDCMLYTPSKATEWIAKCDNPDIMSSLKVETTTKSCPKCGANLPITAKFCNFCGTKF